MRLTTALAALLASATGVLLVFVLALNSGQSAPEGPPDAVALALVVALLAFPATGFLLASRVPRNPIGWLFLTVGLGFFGSFGFEGYAIRALVTDPGSLPLGIWAAWLSSWMWILWLAPVALAILLFPDGRLPTRRARPLVWLIAAWSALQFVMTAFAPRALQSERLAAFMNPAGVQAVASLSAIEEVTGIGFVLVMLATLLVLWLRLRRARGIQRLQLRWFVYAAGLLGTMALLLLLTEAVMTLLGLDLIWLGDLLWFAFIASFSGLPLAASVAILRYRLYDIDVLINRTVVYGTLTATLGAAYVGSVLLLQTLLRPFTAGSDIAVAVSTLAVVALFQPLRRRIQDAVDRRFYRSRYDAQRTLDAFAGRLRNEVDLDGLERELVAVVGQTIRPAHASLWLRVASRPTR